MAIEGVILYDREKNGIRVTAVQGPVQTVMVEQGEGCQPKEVKKHEYIITATKDGVVIREEKLDGYRQTPNAARKMFKELTDEFVPKKPAKIVKTQDPAKLTELAEKAEARGQKALALAAKYREALAALESGDTEAAAAITEAAVTEDNAQAAEEATE